MRVDVLREVAERIQDLVDILEEHASAEPQQVCEFTDVEWELLSSIKAQIADFDRLDYLDNVPDIY